MDRRETETEFGTTIVGLVADGGVVLASDRRASAGGMVSSKRAKKVFEVGDRAGLAFTGAVSGAQALVSRLDNEVRLYELRRDRRMPVDALASLAGNVMRGERFGVQHLLGGVDADGPRLYGFDAGGAALEHAFAADGSGGPTAYGLLEAEYAEGMPLDAARSLAARAVAAACERDLASGNGLRVATFTGEGTDVAVYDDPAVVAS
ncbi:proteasome subunit beta [Candidatus Halobonum tyrrellensis]|uniref:Proteasome subunit beta n=1 Tax=Candidatus Halobonum tyrrellensis G22 TaxID=1324957 RepID=V4HC14_9EURY|nr:proteasome subunit beta [Candidatus Halobonum tyrrellensis]ESP88245.1 proteasome beta subunit [Candidatus Halobonum tyrrellensis G22]